MKSSQQILVELFGKSKALADKTMNSIIEGFNNKNPKVIAACVDAIAPLLLNYGVHKLQLLKPFLKEIEKLAEHNAANIKTSTIIFFK